MPVREERFEVSNLLRLGVRAQHLVDGEDLQRVPAAGVGNHRVLVARLVQQDRLGRERKQVDDRGAVQAEGLGGDPHLQRLLALVALEGRYQEEDLDLRAEPGRRHLLQPREIEEEELLGKGKILLQETVSGKGAARIGQHRILFAGTRRVAEPRAGASPAGFLECGVRSRTTIRVQLLPSSS